MGTITQLATRLVQKEEISWQSEYGHLAGAELEQELPFKPTPGPKGRRLGTLLSIEGEEVEPSPMLQELYQFADGWNFVAAGARWMSGKELETGEVDFELYRPYAAPYPYTEDWLEGLDDALEQELYGLEGDLDGKRDDYHFVLLGFNLYELYNDPKILIFDKANPATEPKIFDAPYHLHDNVEKMFEFFLE